MVEDRPRSSNWPASAFPICAKFFMASAITVGPAPLRATPRSAGHAGNRENFREAGDQRLAIGLMQAILHRFPQQVVPASIQGCEK